MKTFESVLTRLGARFRAGGAFCRIRTVIFRIALSVFAVLIALPTTAGRLEDGLEALERGDHAAAFEMFQPLAEQGNAQAQYNLGAMYLLGAGVQPDVVLTFLWWNAATASGHEDAAENLGYIAQLMAPDEMEAALDKLDGFIAELVEKRSQHGSLDTKSEAGGTGHSDLAVNIGSEIQIALGQSQRQRVLLPRPKP
ncbi:MAG TPA: hypothetical protein VK862_08155, partial [Afifellaceae bacterium]|nr:hypothetical protein [Afifellaceae bacterium]